MSATFRPRKKLLNSNLYMPLPGGGRKRFSGRHS
jgi:hypothetical protein